MLGVAEVTTYQYDVRGRLVSTRRQTNALTQTDYALDRVGNRRTVTTVRTPGGSPSAPATPAPPRS